MILTPMPIVDYVVVHELVHLKEKNKWKLPVFVPNFFYKSGTKHKLYSTKKG